jgi:hypothetical protein
MAILPFGVGFFVGPLTTPLAVRALGGRIASLGLAIETAGLVMLAGGVNASGLAHALLYNPGLFAIGIGQGIVLPSLVRIVIQDVDEHYAGAASGVVTSTLQISSALGVATLGSVFFAVVAGRSDAAAITRGFTVTLLSLGAVLSCAAVLALWLKGSYSTGLEPPPAGESAD